MFIYLGSIIYAVFHETHTDTMSILLKSGEDYHWLRHSEVWILTEILVFFGAIFSSTFYLLTLQILGEAGQNNDPNFQRFKYDTLSYYDEDIEWFSYMFVCFCVHFMVFLKHSYYPATTDNKIKMVFSVYMMVFALVKLCLCMPFRHADRTHKVITMATWSTLFALEAVGGIFFFFFKYIGGSSTFGSFLIDVVVLLGMLAKYKIHEGRGSEVADNEEPLIKCFGRERKTPD